MWDAGVPLPTWALAVPGTHQPVHLSPASKTGLLVLMLNRTSGSFATGPQAQRQAPGPPAWAAAEIGSAGAQGAGPRRPGAQLPLGRTRGRAEQEYGGRHWEPHARELGMKQNDHGRILAQFHFPATGWVSSMKVRIAFVTASGCSSAIQCPPFLITTVRTLATPICVRSR